MVTTNLATLFLLLTTPAQTNPLTLTCTGKNGKIDMVPSTAVLNLDKLTFRPPWLGVTSSINRVTETEISFSFTHEMMSGHGTLNRVTGRVDYSTTCKPDTGLSSRPDLTVGVCKPAKPLF
jgi:hypothetical protein